MTALPADTVAILTAFFQYLDADHDGYVTINEIRDACSVDVNADGVVSSDEVDIGALPWLRELAQQDTNGDQKLTLQELLQYNLDLAV